MITTEQVRLAEYTTLRLGGPAARFVSAASEDELIATVRAADAEAEPVLVLGGGSNLVVADEGFPGVVVLTGARSADFAAAGDAVDVTVAAGHDWDEFVQDCVAQGLSGVECLSGIPGRAGATPIQNVNAYGQDVADTITSVRVYDRLSDQVVVMAAADCGFGYRSSVFKRQATAAGRGAALNPASATGRFVILAVTFRLPVSPLSAPIRYGELSRVLGVADGDRVPLAAARAAVLELRRGKGMVLTADDPDTRSAGSFFTNPVITAAQYGELAARLAVDGELDSRAALPHWPASDGHVKLSAAWLIEHAGFSKGWRLPGDPDGARISTKHALALTNPGQATTAGLIRLAREIRAGVLATFAVTLANEPVLVGVEL
ncbi:MAG TPA: UDP-N-acetylmuramate dehydrogenase [Streptosporangiaceae bacterium]|nr:UDP-N-acetylmuramate dehydrogenase [Streptosporangiaceae bacterium]